MQQQILYDHGQHFKNVIKSLQGSAVTQTVLDGQTIYPSYRLYVSKIMKIGWP